jgi:hypothetical protein
MMTITEQKQLLVKENSQCSAKKKIIFNWLTQVSRFNDPEYDIWYNVSTSSNILQYIYIRDMFVGRVKIKVALRI